MYSSITHKTAGKILQMVTEQCEMLPSTWTTAQYFLKQDQAATDSLHKGAWESAGTGKRGTCKGRTDYIDRRSGEWQSQISRRKKWEKVYRLHPPLENSLHIVSAIVLQPLFCNRFHFSDAATIEPCYISLPILPLWLTVLRGISKRQHATAEGCIVVHGFHATAVN